MSHQVGGLLDLPHGVVNGVLLPHVIRFNAAVAGDRFVPLAAMAGLHGGSDEVGDVLADEVRSVADRLGVPKGLSQLGVTEADIPTLAANAMVDACLSTNPRPVEVDDLAALFRAAL
jgi:1,3-propanediol dehydrogenase